MEDTLSFLFLCATGVACYWFFSSVWTGLRKFNVRKEN